MVAFLNNRTTSRAAAARAGDDRRRLVEAMLDAVAADSSTEVASLAYLLEEGALDAAGDLTGDEIDWAIEEALGALPPERFMQLVGGLAAPEGASASAELLVEEVRADARAMPLPIQGASGPWRDVVGDVLDSVARLLGLPVGVEQAEKKLALIFDDDPFRAAEIRGLTQRFGSALGLGTDEAVSIHADAIADERLAQHGDALGLFAEDRVYLPSDFHADDRDDQALLAHELAHAAQARQGRGELAPAEAEAGAVLDDVLAGRSPAAVTEGLALEAEAACGPREMIEKKQGKDKEKKGGGSSEKKEEKKEKKEEKKEDDIGDKRKKPESFAGAKASGEVKKEGECKDACPDPLKEHDETKATNPPATPKSGSGELVEFKLAGHKIKIRLPDGQAAGRVTINFREADSPYKYLRLKKAIVEVSSDFKVTSGQVYAGVKLGQFVHADDVKLRVDENGEIATSIKGAKVQVGDKIKGVVDLDIHPDGIAGECIIRSDAIKIAPGLTVKDGYLRVKVSKGGAVFAHGQLTVAVGDFVEVKIDACFVDGEFRGHMVVAWTKPFKIAPFVTVERIQLEGCYRKDNWYVAGEIQLDVAGKYGASIKGRYARKGQTGDWSLEGTITQKEDVTFGELRLHSGSAHVKCVNGKFEPLTVHHELQWRTVTGTVDGTYDIEKKKLDARGEAHLEAPLPLGKTGARLEEASLEIVVKQNEPITIEGQAKVVFDYEGQPTFQVDAHAKYDIKQKLVDADGGVKVLRDLRFGPAGGLHAVIAEGSGGGFAMKKSEIAHLGGGIKFTVLHGEHEVGTGGVTFNGGSTRKLDGEARFSLTNRTGLPNVEAGPFFLLPGGSFVLPIKSSRLGKAQAVDVKWELCHPQGTGKVEGQVAGSYDFTNGKASLEGSAKVVETWTVVQAQWGEVHLEKGGDGHVGVTDSRLSKLGGKLPFKLKVNPNGPVPGFELAGEINATVKPKTWKVTGGFNAELLSDLSIPIGQGGDVVKVGKGSSFDGTIANSKPKRLGLNIDVQYHRAGEGLFLQGQVTEGSYDVEAGHLGFNGQLTLKRAVSVSLGRGWRLQVEPEITKLQCQVAKNKLKEISGDIQLTLWDGEQPLLAGSLTKAKYDLTKKDPEFSGDLALRLARQIQVPPDRGGLPPAVSFTALETSHLSGTIRKNKLTTLTIDLQIDAALGGEKKGEARLGGTWNVETGKVTGEGSVSLTDDVAIGAAAAADQAEPTGWQLVFKRASTINVSLKNNALQPATVNIGIGLRRDAADIATGNVSGQYVFGDEGGFTGQIGFATCDDVQLTEAAGFGIFLGGATKATGEVVKSRVKTATGTFELLAKQGGVPMLSARLETTYAGGKFNGAASLKALENVPLGQRVLGGRVFHVELAKDSGGTLQIVDSKPGLASGQLTLNVGLDGLPFARGTFEASYDLGKEGSKISASGALEVIGRATLGKAGMFTFILEAGTGISGAIKDNALEWLEGQLVLGIATDAEGRVGSLTLGGRYDGGEEPNFGGAASAIIDKQFLLGYQAYGYEFGFAPSAFGCILDQGQIVQAGGSLTFIALQRGGPEEAPLGTITVSLQGDYARPVGAAEGSFTGSGVCSVTGQLRVGQAGEYEFFVLGGTSVGIWVDDNEFTKLHGGLTARVDQLAPGAGEDKEFLQLECDVTYVPDEGGKIDAKGTCRMLGRKKILKLGGYEFWLIRGKGAAASLEITGNTLVSVGGTVSCAVYDGDPLPLVEAHAQGTWFRESNKFNGSGDIRLGRDISFPKGKTTGPRVVFKKGSGGGGVVENNEVRRLTGRLNAEIHDTQGKLIAIDASGEYDAVENNVVWAKGTVNLLRPLIIGEDKANPLLVIERLSASGEIKNSELIAVEGLLFFKVPRLWNLDGRLSGGWTNKNGKDEYWGQANIAFTPINEPDKGRKLHGQLTGEFNKDGSWRIGGDVNYKMTPYLESMAHVDVDQNVDPEITAGFTLTKKPILKGRELFGFNSTLFKISAGFMSAGVSAGLSMRMRDLLFSTSFLVSKWKPLSEESEMPTFDATLAIDWGLDFQAKLAAYIMLGLDIFIASFGAGVEGAAALDVALPLHLGGKLHGDKEGFSGELDMKLALKAYVTLSATPFVKASFLWWDWDERWPFEHKMGPVFEWEWGKKYHFGDKEEEPTDAPAGRPQMAEGGKKETYTQDAKKKQAPKLANDKKPAPLPKEPGAPAMDPGADSKGAEAPKEKEGLPGPMGDKMEALQPILDFLGVVGKEMDFLKPVFDCVKDGLGGMILLILRVVFDSGFPSWSEISASIGRIYRAAQKAWAELKPLFKDSLDIETYSVIEGLLGPEPSLMKALFGADDMVRDEVDKGTHRKLPPEGRAKFINIMLDGYCGDDDEDRILTILHFSKSKGDLRSVVNQVEGQGDRIVWKLDGSQDTEVCELFDNNGIDY